MNFILTKHHGYSLAELDGMLPWEREIYVVLLEQDIEKEKTRLKNAHST